MPDHLQDDSRENLNHEDGQELGSRSSVSRTATPARSHRRWPLVCLSLGLTPTCVWAGNQLLVAKPVAAAISADPRNTGYTLSARLQQYVRPNVLVLDLRSVDSATPADLLRGLFQAADTLSQLNRSFERVILARSGKPVFIMSGEDFRAIGRDYGDGQNPMYLVRTLPEKLRRASDGQRAFGTWEGGILGVAMRQMQDVTEAAQTWANGQSQ